MGIPNWAVRGAKVVCVRDDWHQPDLELFGVVRLPMLREVLTIASSRSDGRFDYLGFAEIPFHWSVQNFRPLITQQDDIEVHFRALLDAPQSVDA